MNARSKHHDGETGLVPHRLDFGATAPFIDATLFGFLVLQDQPPVEQYGHWKRALHHAGDGPEEFRVLRAHVPHRRK